jgi:DNA-binding transcriptional ArsR family regulator
MTAGETEFDVFRAIADPSRRRIIAALAERPLAVHEISSLFPISRPAISKHLRLLGEAGLVEHRRRGKENVYALDPAPFAELADWLGHYWSGRLQLLKRIAEGDS